MLEQQFYRIIIRVLNGPVISKILKNFACSNFSKPFIIPYAKIYKINLEESLEDMKSYRNLHAFFTRNLKDSARPIDMGMNTVVSPVDGILEDIGNIEINNEIMVKNKSYSIIEMLGHEERALRYADGTYLILYLSPSHYHRIHSPLTVQVVDTYELGGRSFPVNRLGIKYGDATLAKNYRIVSELIHDNKRLAMVKVGAMFINSIQRVNNHREWKKGEEVAYFSFGSTVVLLFEKNTFTKDSILSKGDEVKMGSVLGKMND